MLQVCLNSCSSTTGGAATPHYILPPSFVDENRVSMFFHTEAVKKAELLPIAQPTVRGLFSLRVFLFPLVYPPYLSFPSSCFLNPCPFLFLFPTVLFFGLTLQLYHFKLFLCVLAEKSLTHLHCWSLPGCTDAACNSVFGCVICVFKCLETTWRN